MNDTTGAAKPSLSTRTTMTMSEHPIKRSLLPQDYAHHIDIHSKRSAAETVYPGVNFSNLATYLRQTPSKQDAVLPGQSMRADASDSISHSSFVTLYNLGSRISDEAVHFTLPAQVTSLDLDASSDVYGRLLFLRGNIAPEWINALGAKFALDPEFFQRHLDFMRMVARPDYFLLPPLPSASNNMTRFRLNTIGYIMRHHKYRGWLEQADLDVTRKRAEDSWNSYFERLSRVRSGGYMPWNSIVRDFSVHDHDHFSLEQDISVNITSIGGKWLVVVWLDVGRNLTLNADDPWSPQVFQVDPLAISFLPTIQIRDQVAMNSRAYMSRATTTSGESTDPPAILQTASQLHLEYCRRMDAEAAPNSPLIALLDVLRLTVSSEAQLLRLIESKISMELSPAQSQARNEPTVSNLLYHKYVLHRHTQRLLENVNFIRHHADSFLSDKSQSTSSKSKLSAILNDFDYLVNRTRELTTECDLGMTIMMNKASIIEAQKAIVQAKRVTKLTKLAFVFIPMSFISSFFGMNFAQFAPGNFLNIWVWFAISIPVLVLSTIFMRWDVSRQVSKTLRWAWRKVDDVRTVPTELNVVSSATKTTSQMERNGIV